MSNNYFEGWYLKHQKDGHTIAFIPGRTEDSAFVQVITPENSYHIQYPLSEYTHGKSIRIGENIFSKDGIQINIKNKEVTISGEVRYQNLTPIRYDIMGPFKYFPMECYHGVISMRHDLYGSIVLNGRKMDLNHGIGYIEQDRGTSFPKKYSWVQCGDLKENCSVMVSIADIPFMGLHFNGCICIVHYNHTEYRLATYLGAKIDYWGEKKIMLRQGKLRLIIDIVASEGQSLYAPKRGAMTRIIHENASCKAHFRFFIKDRMVFDLSSGNASCEYV